VYERRDERVKPTTCLGRIACWPAVSASPLELSDIYACLKYKDETVYYLEQAYREHAPWLVKIQSDPSFDFLTQIRATKQS
jgi:hypothetical protein